MRKVFFTFLFFHAISGQAKVWDLNDVTYLLPLPSSNTDKNIIKGTELIPADLVQTYDQYSYQKLLLISFRIDPCFKDHFTDVCRSQLRAVWQPVLFQEGEQVTTRDTAVHTFYDLTFGEFGSLKNSLLQLKLRFKINTQGMPLQIHPGFSNPQYAKEIIVLIKKYLSEKSISRIAFFNLLASEFSWSFQSFDVSGILLKPIIPFGHSNRVNPSIQHFFSSSPDRGVLNSQDAPAFFIPYEESEKLTPAQIAKWKYTVAVKIENPLNHLPGTIDCLSCHISNGVKGENAINLVKQATALNGSYNLKNTTSAHSDHVHVRALGYVGGSPSIIDRVINESALVANYLNAKP